MGILVVAGTFSIYSVLSSVRKKIASFEGGGNFINSNWVYAWGFIILGVFILTWGRIASYESVADHKLGLIMLLMLLINASVLRKTKIISIQFKERSMMYRQIFVTTTVEEVMYRGVILGAVVQIGSFQTDYTIPIIICSLMNLFQLPMYYPGAKFSKMQLLMNFSLNCFLGYLAIVTNSVAYPIVAHVASNAIILYRRKRQTKGVE